MGRRFGGKLGQSGLTDLSRLKRRLAAVFAALAVLLTAGGFLYYRHHRSALRADAEKLLLSIEHIKLDQLRLWREGHVNSTLSLLDGQRVSDDLRTFAANPAAGLRARLKVFIERNNYEYAAITDADGRVLLHAGGRPEVMCPQVASLIARAKISGRPELGDFYLRPGEEAPHIDLLAPAGPAVGRRQLFLLLRVNPADSLYPLLFAWSAKGETGEILLAGRDGEELVFLNDLRHVKDAAMRLRRPLNDQTLPAAMGLRGETGIVEGLDYRGVPVIAAVGQVPGTNWALVTKMDREEVLKGAGTLAVLLSLLVLALLAAAGAVAYLLVTRQTLAYEGERRRNEEINAARLRLLQYAAAHTLDELLEETLNEAEKLTGSRIGFYHFVKEDQRTLTLQNWSSATKARFCKAEGKGSHYDIDKAGVWVECFHKREPVIHNDYASLPAKKGMPEGHATVVRELVVPVLRGEKVLALLGVGNKPVDYKQEDVSAVSLLADLAWEIAERKSAEEALRKSEKDLKEAQRLARLGNWTLDLTSNKLEWSEEIFRIFEIDPSQFGASYEAFLGLIHPADRESVNEAYTESLKTRKPYDIVHRLLMKDGRVKYVSEHCETFYDAEGRPLRSVGTVQDVTELKRAQELLTRLTDQVPGVVYQYRLYPDGRSRFPYASSGMELIYEVTSEEVREDATPVFGRIHPDDLKATSEAISASARDLSVFHWEFRVVLPRQGLRWRLCDARPERTPDGGTLWHGIITDITDRKLADEALENLAKQRELALSAARLGWWRYDPVSGVSSYDERYKEIFEVTGSSQPNAEILKRLHPEDLPGVWARVEAALNPADPKPYAAEYRVVIPGGAVKWVEAHGLARFEGAGKERKAAELLGTVADITARKLAETEIRKLNQELLAKNKEMENFLYITTHDLRSPLVNIQGFSQNLQRFLDEIRGALAEAGLPPERAAQTRKLTEEKVPEALGFVLESSAKMDALLGALLKVSRLGRQELRPERLEMGPLLQRIVDTMLFQVREAGAEVKIGALPPCRADAVSVSQLFSNLLDNAVKYRAPERPLTIEVGGELRAGRAVYRVVDNGPGIPADDLERLWEVFYKPPRPGRKNGEGIGLPMCRRIAERNGGAICVEPAPGGGTVFVVELPAA